MIMVHKKRWGGSMEIKVVVNYPDDPEALKALSDRQSQAIIKVLQSKLPPEELDKLMEMYKKKYLQ